MLSDLLSVENLFGATSAALFIEDVLSQYEPDYVRWALDNGFLVKRRICIGPDCGRELCWLSELGRQEAVRKVH